MRYVFARPLRALDSSGTARQTSRAAKTWPRARPCCRSYCRTSGSRPREVGSIACTPPRMLCSRCKPSCRCRNPWPVGAAAEHRAGTGRRGEPVASTDCRAVHRCPEAGLLAPFLYWPSPNLPSGCAARGVSGTALARRPAGHLLGWARRGFVQPTCPDLTGESLAFVHAHVGLGNQRRQIVGVAAHSLAGESPVERYADLVDNAAFDEKRSQAARHHRARFDAARADCTVSQPP